MVGKRSRVSKMTGINPTLACGKNSGGIRCQGYMISLIDAGLIQPRLRKIETPKWG